VTGYPAGEDLHTSLAEVEREIAARRPEHSIDPSLDRIADLASLLGDPQRACPVIHVTGTNGKTSTARMIDALLRARGLRTGLFTSPHLTDMRERIALDGQPIDEQRFVELYEEIAPYVAMVDGGHEVPMSFFEVLTGMAFAAFADAPVDVAVVEVGMGGTWDSTNIADGTIAVVTPVSLDHTRYLGSTVEEIAEDKGGIIKPGAVAVLAQQPVAAAEVLLRRAAEVGATVAREGIEFGVLERDLAVGGQLLELRGLRGDYHEIFLPLFGAHQAGNASVALAAVEAFAGAGENDAAARAGEPVPLDETWVREAFASVTSPGRLEVLRRSPVIIVDAAHNPAGMAAATDAVTEAFTFTRLVGVLAVSADKDVPALLDQLEPVVSDLIVTRNSSPRSMEVPKLAELAESVFGPDRVHPATRLDEAIDLAVTLADEVSAEDGSSGSLVPGSSGVFIAGSVITAGDARALLVGGPAVASGRQDRQRWLPEPSEPDSEEAGSAADRYSDDPEADDPEAEDRYEDDPEPGERYPDARGPGDRHPDHPELGDRYPDDRGLGDRYPEDPELGEQYPDDPEFGELYPGDPEPGRPGSA
jgi:dihydrofolate synthase/folylpolyglutamate synthase